MNIGILGLGPVGRSFVDLLVTSGHKVFAYDKNPDFMHGLPRTQICACEEEVGREADFLLCCTDMLSGDALTKAAKVMKPRTVVSGDFSAKTPEYDALKASGRLDDLTYWSIHTVFAPKLGFNKQLIIEIPVRRCTQDGTEHPFIRQFRDTLRAAGARFMRLWSVQNHDIRMGRVQGAISAQNICTAATLAELGINPLTDDTGIYSGKFDEVNLLMALRATGKAGSSNHRVYGLIAMMNPYSLMNIAAYARGFNQLIEAAEGSTQEALDLLERTRETLGWERVEKASRLWDSLFGSEGNTRNSFSSHLAAAVAWAKSDAPLEMFEGTPSPPYRIRELTALKALSMPERCIRNMQTGKTHDGEFLKTVNRYRRWAQKASKARDWASVDEFETLFFDPVRIAFSEVLKTVDAKTNELIRRIK